MIANLLHCAIADPSQADTNLDYVNPLYSSVGSTDSERLVRSILLGQNNPPSDSKFYSSVVIRRLLRRDPFASIAHRFGLEGGWPLEDLKEQIFSSYRLVADSTITVSNEALHARLPVYAVHRLVCVVNGSAVSVSNRSYGVTNGVINAPIRVPGMGSDATVTVREGAQQQKASWATRPSISYGSIAETLATIGRPALLTLKTTPGLLFEDEREALMRCITTSPVAADRVGAGALLLANAVYTRLGFV